MRSLIFSRPTDRRIRSSVTPVVSRSAAESCWWVVLALRIAHVGQAGEDLDAVDDGLARFEPALDAEGEDAAEARALAEVAGGIGVVGVVRQAGVVHPAHFGMLLQPLGHGQGVGAMPLHAQVQGLDAQEDEEGVERADGGSCVAQALEAGLGDEGCRAREVGQHGAVVGGEGLRELGELAVLPVEGAAVHDDARDGGAVAAQELGRAVDHDVRAQRQRVQQVGAGQGVVHDEGDAGGLGDGGDGPEVGHIQLGVAEGLQVDGAGLRRDGGAESLGGPGIHEGGGDARAGEGVVQQVVGAAIEVVTRDDVFTATKQGREGQGDGRLP